MSDKRRESMATLTQALGGLDTGQFEALLERQPPEVRRELEKEYQKPETKEEVIDTPGPQVVPGTAKNQVQKKVYRATVAGRTVEREAKSRPISALERTTDTIASYRGMFQGGLSRLGGLPTVGGIGVPLFLVLIFYFALLPVRGADGNAHTRLGWLWMVLTNNAHITNSTYQPPQGTQETQAAHKVGTGGGPPQVAVHELINPALHPAAGSYGALMFQLENL